jgi:hypothetical protein
MTSEVIFVRFSGLFTTQELPLSPFIPLTPGEGGREKERGWRPSPQATPPLGKPSFRRKPESSVGGRAGIKYKARQRNREGEGWENER